MIDVFGTNAPDGIVGPHHEKEASFYTIKEIWSPVRITRTVIPRQFDGKLDVENHYSFTDLSQCQFRWQLVSFPKPTDKSTQAIVNQSGTLPAVAVPPGEKGYLRLSLPANWTSSDALYLTAIDPNGRELFTWSWPVPALAITPANAPTVVASASAAEVNETNTLLTVRTGSQVYTFDKSTGYLVKVNNAKSDIALSNGPMLAGVTLPLKSFQHQVGKAGYEITTQYEGNRNRLTVHWLLVANQPAEMTYSYVQRGDADFMGITFDFPEQLITGMKWLGRGPYRVWKNRLKGQKYGVWHKEYNDAVTGEDFQYPEFKGYHADVKWVVIETKQGNFTVYADSAIPFLQMLQPRLPKAARNSNTSPAFPAGSIGFLNGISPIGTKFQAADVPVEGGLECL